jgi:uncharacterized membrane protein YphA (DoxX/SURF4 family)
MHLFLAAILFGGGLFSLVVAIFDVERFMAASNAKPVVDAIGRRSARVFYALLGVFLVTVGILFVTGVLTIPEREVATVSHSSE